MTKFLSFLFRVLTGTPAVLQTLGKVSGPTLAAILAVFYDVMKFLVTEGGAIKSITSGDVSVGISTILSEQTRELVAKIATDFTTAEKTVVDDFHQLGIAASTGSGTTTA